MNQSFIGKDSLWAVWRQDTHGNVFMMRDGLSKHDAERIAQEFEAKGHKQHYWVKPSLCD